MNFYIKAKLGTSEKEVLVATLIKDRYYNVKEILSTPSLTTGIYLTSSDDVDYPYLIADEGGQNIDATKLYQILSNCSDDVLDDTIAKLYKALNGKFEISELQDLTKCFKEFNSYIAGDRVTIKMALEWYDNVKRTKALVEEINNSGKTSEMYIEGENKTVRMKSEDDEFFIRVPSYEELSAGVDKLPTFNKIYSPYSENDYLLTTKKYRKRLTNTEEPVFDANGNRIQTLKCTVPAEYVVGDPNNNDVPLQPREMRYYNALKSLMDTGIQKQFPDKTVEECIENHIGNSVVRNYVINVALMGAFQNWRHTGFIPLGLNDELQGTELDDDDDDDNNDNDNDDKKKDDSIAKGKREFERDETRVPTASTIFDGANYLKEVLEEMFAEDVYSVIEIAIKLNRFGKNKPSRIKFPNGMYFDLNTFRLTNGSGNYSATEEVRDDEGNNLVPLNFVVMTDSLTDYPYAKALGLKATGYNNLPIGILCRKSYKNTDDGFYVYLSFIDLFMAYKDNDPNCKISGFTYSDGEFTINQDFLDAVSANYKIQLKDLCMSIKSKEALPEGAINLPDDVGSYLQNYSFSGFQDAFFAKDCYDNKVSILNIINTYYSSNELTTCKAFEYNTTEELDDLIVTTRTPPRTCIERNMVRFLLPIIDYVYALKEADAEEGKISSIPDIINFYGQAINALVFDGSFIDKSQIEKKEKVEPMQPLQSFSQPEVSQQPSSEPVSITDQFIQTDLNGYEVCKLILPKHLEMKVKAKFPKLVELDVFNLRTSNANGTVSNTEYIVIGYIAAIPQNKKSSKVLINPTLSMGNVTRTLDARTLGTVLSNTVKRVAKGKEPLYKYTDIDTCTYYCNLINSMTAVALEEF